MASDHDVLPAGKPFLSHIRRLPQTCFKVVVFQYNKYPLPSSIRNLKPQGLLLTKHGKAILGHFSACSCRRLPAKGTGAVVMPHNFQGRGLRGHVLGPYTPLCRGCIGVMLGLYRDNGKNGKYLDRVYSRVIGLPLGRLQS